MRILVQIISISSWFLLCLISSFFILGNIAASLQFRVGPIGGWGMRVMGINPYEMSFIFILAFVYLLLFLVLRTVNPTGRSIVSFFWSVLFGSLLFGAVGWFYFPHFNQKGWNACKELADKYTGIWTKEEFGSYDDFAAINGQPNLSEERYFAKYYCYSAKSAFDCCMDVDTNGIIQRVHPIPID